jgi:hypothetical protein
VVNKPPALGGAWSQRLGAARNVRDQRAALPAKRRRCAPRPIAGAPGGCCNAAAVIPPDTPAIRSAACCSQPLTSGSNFAALPVRAVSLQTGRGTDILIQRLHRAAQSLSPQKCSAELVSTKISWRDQSGERGGTRCRERYRQFLRSLSTPLRSDRSQRARPAGPEARREAGSTPEADGIVRLPVGSHLTVTALSPWAVSKRAPPIADPPSRSGSRGRPTPQFNRVDAGWLVARIIAWTALNPVSHNGNRFPFRARMCSTSCGSSRHPPAGDRSRSRRSTPRPRARRWLLAGRQCPRW